MVAVLAADGRSVKTFTLGLEGDKASELPAAAEVAKHFGTAHQEIVVAPGELVAGLAGLIEARDAPVARPSELAVHHLAAVAGRSVHCLLSGDGCDEVLGGYRRHLVPGYASWEAGRDAGEREKLLAFDVLGEKQAKKQPPFDADPNASALRRALYFGQTSWLPDELLERNDRAAAAAGIDARLPYLDHRLAQYVSSLPDDQRVRGLATKWILRQAGRELIPGALARRRKGGFRMPIRDWLRNELRDTLLEHLQSGSSRTRKYYDAARLDRMLDEHLRGKNNHARSLWTLLNLEIWHRLHLPA
jgi:asparagine synthase (glutamine-hydrolysing)